MSSAEKFPVHMICKINEVPTHVAFWGQKDNKPPTVAPDEVIIFIPGNPGLANFYYDYLYYLHKNTNLPVWIIAHAGHDQDDAITQFSDFTFPPVEGSEHLYNLRGQLRHKVEFLLQFTKKNSKVHLIGHSIGGWITTELLKNDQLEKRIVSTSLLFPTIEHIAKTPNGFWVNKVLRRITSLVMFFVWIFHILPYFLKTCLIYIYMYFNSYPKEFMLYIHAYLKPSVIEKVLFLAYDEMDLVRRLDARNLVENSHRIKIIYADDDHWAPGEGFRKLKHYIPELYIKQVSYKHAFVIHSSKEMADVTKKLIFNEELS